MSQELRAAVVNVCSVRNKLDEIINIIIQNDLDILALTEIWLTSDDKDQFYVNALTLPGYNLYCYPRKDNAGHGGAAVLVRATISVRSATQYVADSFENCVIYVAIDSSLLDVCVIYRPPPNTRNKLTTKQFTTDFG